MVDDSVQRPDSPNKGDFLTGKNVLITGAGPNIGKSLAREMGNQGCQIFFTDLNPSWISDLEKQLQLQQVTNKGFAFDISKTEDPILFVPFWTKTIFPLISWFITRDWSLKTNSLLLTWNSKNGSKHLKPTCLGPCIWQNALLKEWFAEGIPPQLFL